LRVVFDTNVLISALIFPGGNGEQALERIVEERDRLLLSRAIVGELLEVLARKFTRDREELARVAVFVAGVAEMIEPQTHIRVLADEPDNRILECAAAGDAALIVTGDKRMLALARYEGTAIVSLRSYLDEY